MSGYTPKRPDPVWVRKVNIRCERGGLFVDLYGGQEGGAEPQIVAFDFGGGDWERNRAQHWHIYSLPGRDTQILIKSDIFDGYLLTWGNGCNVRCDRVDPWNESAHWYLEGCDVHNITDNTLIRLRNVRFPELYLDLFQGNTKGGTQYITHPGHGGQNQLFKMWNRS